MARCKLYLIDWLIDWDYKTAIVCCIDLNLAAKETDRTSEIVAEEKQWKTKSNQLTDILCIFVHFHSMTQICIGLKQYNRRFKYVIISHQCQIQQKFTSSIYVAEFLYRAIPSQHNLSWVPRSTRSLSVVTLSCPPIISSLKITDRSFRYASTLLVSEINFQIHYVSLTSLVSIHFLIHSDHSYREFVIITTLSVHCPLLFHSFTPGSKPTFSTNPSHLNRLQVGYPWTAFANHGTAPDLSFSSAQF